MRRPRFDGPTGYLASHVVPSLAGHHDVAGVSHLFIEGFRRDLGSFFPRPDFKAIGDTPPSLNNPQPAHQVFRLVEDEEGDKVDLFGVRYAIGPAENERFAPRDRRLIKAIGTVLTLRYLQLFRLDRPTRMDLYQGSSDDHTIAAFLDPGSYQPHAPRPSRIAATIQTLRTAALSTYENRRISTGVILTGRGSGSMSNDDPTPPDALSYGTELTGLKSMHRLCDGKRTLFLVNPVGKLAGIVDIARFADSMAAAPNPDVPCARAYQPHACATQADGHVCLVLSPNQEIKLFADGAPAFAYTNGRWRVLDVAAKYAVWRAALDSPELARALFQAALNLAEHRQGALFVVVTDPDTAAGRLIAPHDLLIEPSPSETPTSHVTPDALAHKRALHYLARGRSAIDLDPPVLEALAGLDGALATDSRGLVLAFGAILRHDARALPGPTIAEGARSTAALVASHFGAVLKVSEDGIISCFLDGTRVWDL